MKRKQLGEEADRLQIKALLKENNPGWKQTRLTALKIGFDTSNTLEFIAESVGISESTLKRWFAAFRKGGIQAALHRGYGIDRASHPQAWKPLNIRKRSRKVRKL